MFNTGLLVVLELSHPFWPVFGLDAAGLCPRVSRVEFGVPLQGPELLEPDPPYGPIKKKTVHMPIMSIQAEGPHAARWRLLVRWQRCVIAARAIRFPAVEK